VVSSALISSNKSTYLLRMAPAERAELHAMAEAAGIPLSEAFRKGARMYLEAQENRTPEDDELLIELRSLAGRIDSRIRRGS